MSFLDSIDCRVQTIRQLFSTSYLRDSNCIIVFIFKFRSVVAGIITRNLENRTELRNVVMSLDLNSL